jgi:hypothetical protein
VTLLIAAADAFACEWLLSTIGCAIFHGGILAVQRRKFIKQWMKSFFVASARTALVREKAMVIWPRKSGRYGRNIASPDD